MAVPEGVKGAHDLLPPREARFAAVEAAFLETARLGGYAARPHARLRAHRGLRARGRRVDRHRAEGDVHVRRPGRPVADAAAGGDRRGSLRAVLEIGLPRRGGLPLKFCVRRGDTSGTSSRRQVVSAVHAGRHRGAGQRRPGARRRGRAAGWDALRRVGCPGRHPAHQHRSAIAPTAPAYLERLNAFLDRVADLPPEVAGAPPAQPSACVRLQGARHGRGHGRPRPVLLDHVSDDAAPSTTPSSTDLLRAEGVPFVDDPRLVRGLDYYTRTTFEYQVPSPGRRRTRSGGGGRYDGLAEDLGWPERFPGIGWALGVDRTLLAIERSGERRGARPATRRGLRVPLVPSPSRSRLRSGHRPAPRRRRDRPRASTAAALKRTAQGRRPLWRPRPLVLLGLDELARDVVTVKDLAAGEQREDTRAEVVAGHALLGPPPLDLGPIRRCDRPSWTGDHTRSVDGTRSPGAAVTTTPRGRGGNQGQAQGQLVGGHGHPRARRRRQPAPPPSRAIRVADRPGGQLWHAEVHADDAANMAAPADAREPATTERCGSPRTPVAASASSSPRALARCAHGPGQRRGDDQPGTGALRWPEDERRRRPAAARTRPCSSRTLSGVDFTPASYAQPGQRGEVDDRSTRPEQQTSGRAGANGGPPPRE